MNKIGYILLGLLVLIVIVGISAFVQKGTQVSQLTLSMSENASSSTPITRAQTTVASSSEAQSTPSPIDLCSGQSVPQVWSSATSTNGTVVTLANNNLYVNGIEIVNNIPALLGLSPADGVSTQSSFEDIPTSKVKSCDYYAPLALSPEGDKVAVVYGRAVRQHNSDYYQTPSVSELLVYSLKGALLLKEALMSPMSPLGISWGISSAPAPVSYSELNFVSGNAIIITYYGKGGSLGSPVLYRMDGTESQLPYGSTDPGISALSPDASEVLYDNQGSSCPGLAEVGETDRELSDLSLFDVAQATSTTVMCNPNIGFYPQSWSADGTKALAITVDPGFKANGYIIYDMQTRKGQLSDAPGAVDLLKHICATTFSCPDLSRLTH